MEAERRMESGLLLEKAADKEREMKKLDIVSNPHKHPLIYYREGRQEEGIYCVVCGEVFSPPAFGCSEDDCSFNVHQSCLDLPDEITSPWHTHPLSLRPSYNLICFCCGQKPFGSSYGCIRSYGLCYVMDVQCIIADPEASSLLKTAGGEFRHLSHPHPLTLHLDTHPERRKRNIISVCLVCERPIIPPSTYYFCSQSICHSYTLHQQCAELPRQILKPHLHPDHPLFLFAKPWQSSTLCRNCKYQCTNFFYSCPPCNFNLHVDCVTSFKHEHHFRVLRNKLSYDCHLCLKSGKGFPWLCTVCLLFAHEDCAIRKMSEHHYTSAQASNSYSIIQEHEIQHFSHEQHKLRLCRPHEDVHCDGCMRRISTESQSYACPPCGFYLHQECASLPTQHNNSFLHWHVLSLVYIPDFVFSCSRCLQYCHGFAYRCEDCHYAIDIRCAPTTFPFTHSSHPPHPLTDYNKGIGERCRACGEWLHNRKAIGCEDCKFYLDVTCAHLPLAVKNRFDEHPLILTFVNDNEDENSNNNNYEDENSNDNEEESSEEAVYCDICEEERNVKKWFYHCRLCDFSAHPNCLLGDHPFLKQAQFENHPHPLSLVNQCKKISYSSRRCGACGDSCDGNLALECGNSACEFNVHAFGQCYNKQLTQGRITFTNMPSLRYRSISLHLDPDEIERWKLISSGNKEVEDGCSPSWSFISQGKIGMRKFLLPLEQLECILGSVNEYDIRFQTFDESSQRTSGSYGSGGGREGEELSLF